MLRLDTLQGALLKQRWQTIAAVALGVLVVNVWAWEMSSNDVLEIAYSYPEGGGYCALSDTGVIHSVKYNGSTIVPASHGGSYCCGFTFEVAMHVAEERALLTKKSVTQVRNFQHEWYGITKGTEAKECVAAMIDLGVGREIAMENAQPGDFVTFQRTKGPGHSVVFLEWIKDHDGKIIGLRYRSSQGDTHGVADHFEYFADSGLGLGTIDRKRFFIGRLGRRWWSRILHPLGG